MYSPSCPNLREQITVALPATFWCNIVLLMSMFAPGRPNSSGHFCGRNPNHGSVQNNVSGDNASPRPSKFGATNMQAQFQLLLVQNIVQTSVYILGRL